MLLAAAIFFTSGVPALVYQLTWQRILALHSGVGIYSIAMIVAAFMAGLGIGSELGGRLSQRYGPVGALRAFALVELAIAGFAALSPWLYYDLLYQRLEWLYEQPWLAGFCHFAALLPPTCLMGMSLPLLVRAMVIEPEHACRTIGYLYGVNGLGAAVGALITPWVLIPWWGIQGAIYAAAVLNLVAGLGALAMSRFLARDPRWTANTVDQPGPVAQATDTRSSALDHRGLFLWALLYGTSGFSALGLEMVWFRLIDVGVKSTAFTFGTVLAIFLTGLAFGSACGARFEARWVHPRRTFLILQMLIAGYTALSVVLIVRLPVTLPVLSSLFHYWRQYEPYTPGSLVSQQGSVANPYLLYVFFPALLLLVPTTLMGLSFAVLQRAVHDDSRTSGRKVGLLQAANIAGGVLGSLLIGLVAIELWGTAGTLRLLVGLAFVFVAIGLFESQRWPFFIGGACLAGLLFLLPSQDELWRRMHGLLAHTETAGAEAPAWFGEDASGLAAITPELGDQSAWRMSVNGKGHSVLPFGAVHSGLGVFPAIIHPAPVDVAVIGLGSGDTPWAVACRPETQRVDVFEICAPERELLANLDEAYFLPQLRRLLNDDRIVVIHADGRNALRANHKHYDIIEADASRPDSAYGGNLYSLEFFRECAARLKQGGLMCTWNPTPRVYVTFCRAFPHVLAIGAHILIGSHEPIPIDLRTWRARLEQPEVAKYIGEEKVPYALATLASCMPAVPEMLAGEAIDSNQDLFPRDEFHHQSAVIAALERQQLASIHTQMGNDPAAREWLQAAVRLYPDLPVARTQLGVYYARLGNLDESERELREAIRLAPNYVDPALFLGQLLLARGRAAEARPYLERAANLHQASALSAQQFALALAQLGHLQQAVEWFERSLERDPENVDSLQSIAWLLATAHDADLRDPVAAMRYAERAVQSASNKNASRLDVLAAVYAANGRFSEAISTAEEAERLAQEAGETALHEAIGVRLRLYRASRPFVQAAPLGASAS